MSKALVLPFCIALAGCSKSETVGGAAVPSVKLTCANISELDACWTVIVEKTKSCFFFVPGYSSSTDTLGVFNAGRTSCSHGNKRVDFSPAVTGDGFFPTETIDAALTFYNSGSLCLKVAHTANSSNCRIASYSDSSGLLYKLEPNAGGAVRFCGGINYEAGPTELANLQSQCPNAPFGYREGNGQAGASPNPTSLHYYFSNPSTQEIACLF